MTDNRKEEKKKNQNIKQNDKEEVLDIVDEASMESFPASDPPNYIQRKPEESEDKK